MKKLILPLSLLFIVLLNPYSYAGDSTPVLIRDACPANTCEEIEADQLQLANMSLGIVGGSVPAAAGGDGSIGSLVATQVVTNEVTKPVFVILTPDTLGNVRYGHLSINTADGTETVCLSLHQNTNDGTVHLSGSGTAPSSGWLNIDMGETFELVTAADYWLTVQSDDPITMNSGTYGGGSLRKDNAMAYNCGATVTNDNEFTQRIIKIVFNNSAGDPD